jgi:hypothetical protein
LSITSGSGFLTLQNQRTVDPPPILEIQRTGGFQERIGGFQERTVGFWVVLSISLLLRMAILDQNWFSGNIVLKDGGYGIKRIALITIAGLGPSDTHSTLVPTLYMPPRKEGGGWHLITLSTRRE